MTEGNEFKDLLRRWVRESTRLSMQGFFGYAKRAGVSMPQIGALFNIRKNRELGVAELGGRLHVTSAAASQMLDKLVQQGLVTRSENPGDRRQKLLGLTEDGRKVLRASVDARQVWIDDLVEALSPAERELVFRSVALLLEKMKSVAGGSELPWDDGEGMDKE